VVCANFLHLNHPVFWIGSGVEDMNGRAFKQHRPMALSRPAFQGVRSTMSLRAGENP
jgi:hypothetical protein